MSTREAAFCGAAVIISRRARYGIFHRHISSNEHGKLLMMSPSMDRSGGLGFRCVQDAE